MTNTPPARRTRRAVALGLGLCLGLALGLGARADEPPRDVAATDPHLWLEEVQGEAALAWVRERNAQTRRVLQAHPTYEPTRERLLRILDSKERIPSVVRHGPHLYNLWRDEQHKRGLWRRTTLAEYRKPQPAWQTVLDLDAVAASEGENWVWSGATCLAPAYRRCLLSLSRGGADAAVVREFDTGTRRFVGAADGGFTLPEAKTNIDWIDGGAVYVGTDFGPGSLTDAGYPRVVKRWRRGQALADAATVFEGERGDVAAWVKVDRTPGFERTVFGRQLDFYRSREWLLERGALRPLPKPDDATLTWRRGQVLLELRSELAQGERRHPRGALLAADAAAFLRGRPRWTALFTPTPARSLAGIALTRRHVLVQVLDDVAGRLQEWRLERGRWVSRAVAAPFPGSLSVQALHDPLLARDDLAEHYLLSFAGFTTPDTLSLARAGSDRRTPLKSRPAFFDAAGVKVEQHFATSADGTRVPYFVVWPRGAVADGRNPTVLYGYGGFEVSLQPWYSAGYGSAWIERGGVFVVANIRGGGEYGPAWHQAATKAGKQRSYDDFIAVAEDLIARRITRPAQLGIEGGSNGGLLVGAVMLQRPELFGAVVSQVPLLDMKRYHRLLAGASWQAEYGNPDDPAEWAWISKYSPYQNVRAGQRLPPVLFTTSTRDDRVHPGHARKMAARMREQGHEVLYFENIEGGHGGAADNAQRADVNALEFAFFWQRLGR